MKKDMFSVEKAMELFMDYGSQEDIDNMEVFDVISQFHSLRDDYNYIPPNFTLQISISDDEETYENMSSQYVLFYEGKPVYSTLFSNIISVNGGFYRGINVEGLEDLFKAVEIVISGKPDVLIEVSGGVAYLVESPEYIKVEIKDWDNEE